MQRRDLLLGAGSTLLAADRLARPALAQAAPRTLKFIPEGNLQNPDPIWTTTTVARNFGYLVWDTLYGVDESLTPRPQMCQGHEVTDNGLTWRFRLRDGLTFHDGEPVRAADCIASIARWIKRDGFGQRIEVQLNEMRATDDQTFEIRLQRPFPLMLEALAKPSANVCFVMPERVAKTDAFTQISDYTGSGPFRFLRQEWQPGALAAFARFEAYGPRQEKPSFTAGGKQANFDRIEWNIIPDASTAAATIQSGEEDWWQSPTVDLLGLLRRARGVVVEKLDVIGVIPILRFNLLHPPFDNVKLRRALLPAINQADFLDAAMGGEKDLVRTGVGVFTPGSPLANDAGLEVLTGPRDLQKAQRLVAESGYKGETAVLMAPTDYPAIEALCQVTRDLMQRLGINVEYAASDWGTVVQRRASKGPVEQGGWSTFCTTWEGLNFTSPGGHYPIFGTGERAWFGWPTSPRLEELRSAWFDAPDLEAQKKVVREIQLTVWQEVPYIPLGQWFQPIAHRSTVSDIVRSPFPLFWGARKA